MMKYIFVAILISPAAVFAQRRSSASQLGLPGLNGKIKTLTVYFYKNEQDYKTRNTSMKETELFDAIGRRRETTRVYNDNSELKTIYHYEKFRVTDTTYKNGKVSETKIEILDSMGRVLEWDATVYVDNSQMQSKFRVLKFKTILQYDKSGTQIGETTGISGKKPQSKTTYIYDSLNRVAQMNVLEYLSPQNLTIRTVNSYNKLDLKIKDEIYENGKPTSNSSIQYDDFDEHRNWRLSTEETEYYSDRIHAGGTVKSITVREITYFQ